MVIEITISPRPQTSSNGISTCQEHFNWSWIRSNNMMNLIRHNYNCTRISKRSEHRWNQFIRSNILAWKLMKRAALQHFHGYIIKTLTRRLILENCWWYGPNYFYHLENFTSTFTKKVIHLSHECIMKSWFFIWDLPIHTNTRFFS